MQRIFDIILIAVLYCFVFYPKWRQKGWLLVFNTLFYLYICSVLMVTILPIPWQFGIRFSPGSVWQSANLTPFQDFLLGRSAAKKELILNVIMLVPFGVLYPLIKPVRWWKTVLVAFGFSLAIETSQLLMSIFLVSSRAFDVTDLITNTIGALLGCLFSYPFLFFWKRYKK
ncbi:MAG: VanZ family protein [Erysipelotrichaceae bacterium]|nr:VanZ family protein [Erysipelotrichaceae bacterium]